MGVPYLKVYPFILRKGVYVLDVLLSGISLTAKEFIAEAMNTTFGEGTVEIIELNKDNLRQRVRLSGRNVADVLVVLDGVSTDLCKDIENGLYQSDKFFTYTTDEALVEFLNEKYNLSLAIASSDLEISSETEAVNQEIINKYIARAENQSLMINDLKARVQELTSIIEMGNYTGETIVNSEEMDTLKEENLSLHNQILDLTSKGKDVSSRVETLLKERDELKISIEKLENHQKSTLRELESVTAELTEYKVKYSTQSGVIRSKDTEIETLKEKLNGYSSIESELQVEKTEYEVLKKEVDALRLETSKYKVDLANKEQEIARLKREDTDVSSEQLEKVIAERDSLSRDCAEKETRINQLSEEMGKLKENISTLEEKINNLNLEVEEKKEKLKENDETIIQLNKERLKMQDRLTILEKSTSRDSDIESIMTELADLRQKYDAQQRSVFSKVASVALPKSSSPIQLTRGGVHLNHIRFVYAGSTESRKGAYKALLNEFRGLPQSEKVLIVDAVSETSIDYVFEIRKVISGIDWFRKGGGVQNYLSTTCLNNVKVLSAGLGYINDSYLLTVDWESRLTELENSGYNVILFCGDISNIVGRVMHESFASLGNSMIYVHGNAIGSRTIVSNLKGLTNSKDSIVCYFDFNKQMQRFYEIVSKNNECRVLNIV